MRWECTLNIIILHKGKLLAAPNRRLMLQFYIHIFIECQFITEIFKWERDVSKLLCLHRDAAAYPIISGQRQSQSITEEQWFTPHINQMPRKFWNKQWRMSVCLQWRCWLRDCCVCSHQWSTQITYLQCIVPHSDHPAPARETRLLWNT